VLKINNVNTKKKLLLFPFIFLIIVLQIKIIFMNIGDVVDEKDVEKIKNHFELYKN
jgi:hypothetical protein